MTQPKRRSPGAATPTIRCAIYTRKSTEEGLQQDFNTLDAQRESAEKYIGSQQHEGWICLPERYDDGGFTGGNLDRPAVQRLMNDIEAGKIDCVVVYKVDRLSRSLMDFARMMETFEKYKVSFVSVTQQFNTANSMGRLMLNVLLSFAQFEREIISERTRDKIAAARRKGKWSGGKPLLGYDTLALPGGTKLVVNEEEAARVRTIFETYLKHEALIPAVTEIDARGWTNKRWTTRAGTTRGGRRFDKATLYQLLTNVTYLGKVRHKEEVFPGEHPAIIDAGLFQRVQATLQRNGRTGGAMVRNKYGALLKGILQCGSCGCSMIHTYAAKNGRHYRYYVCLNAQKRGWHTCSTKSVPAGEMEQFVVEQIRGVGSDPALAIATVRKARQQAEVQIKRLGAEQATLERDIRRQTTEIRKLATDPTGSARLGDAQDRLRAAEQRQSEVRSEIESLQSDLVDEHDVAESLAAFDPVWATLSPKEQARLIRLLIGRVTYNGAAGSIALTFRPNGFKTLGARRREAAA